MNSQFKFFKLICQINSAILAPPPPQSNINTQPIHTFQSNQTSTTIFVNPGQQKFKQSFSSEFHSEFSGTSNNSQHQQNTATCSPNKYPQESDKPPDFEEAMNLLNTQNKKI